MRQRADEQVTTEREQERRYRKHLADWSRRRPGGGGDAALLHERDAPWLQLTRDRHSTYDKEAEQAVAAGGGIEDVIAATQLPTLEHLATQIDPVLLTRAFDNDAHEQAQPRPLTRGPRPRRLVPDAQLLRRRGAGEPLRTLARDYHVAHTTLGRFFALSRTGFRGDLWTRMLSWGEEILRCHVETEEVPRGVARARCAFGA